MAESAEKRRARHEREKAKFAADPAYAEERRQKAREAERRYQAKQRMQKRSEPKAPVHIDRKPGRIVALCGWMRW